MKDKDEAEPSMPTTSWPPAIQHPDNGDTPHQINFRKPGSLAWIIIWIMSIGRVCLLWGYAVYDVMADEQGTYNMSVIDSIGNKLFPEIFIVRPITQHFSLPTDDLFPGSVLSLMTPMVFLSTFLLGFLFRGIVITEFLRYTNRRQQN